MYIIDLSQYVLQCISSHADIFIGKGKPENPKKLIMNSVTIDMDHLQRRG